MKKKIYLSISWTTSKQDVYTVTCNIFRSVDESKKEITLVVNPENVPVVQAGDGCATNVKAARLVNNDIGIKAPFSICASHASNCE